MSNIQDSINLLVTEGTIEPYTFILSTANHNHLGQIVCLDDKSIKVEVHSNQADKITFTTYKYYQNDNGELVEQPFWNEIQPLKYMYCVELNEYFIIDVELNDEHSEIKISKTITATSQCEVELSNKKIYDLEINTENDYMIADTNNLYYTTYFYKPSNPNLSLLHRVLNFAPAYSIGTIDDSLLKAFDTDVRSFSVSSSTVYDFLTGDVANEFHCIFEFDTVNRVINVHDLYSTCKSCGYYGEFQAQCPNCGSINIDTYGTETTIFVNTRNLTDQVQFITNTDNIKNCFKLTAGDDLMNVAIRELNPSGSNYIYHITDDIKKDFSDSLKEKLSAYDLLYTDTVNNAPLGLDSNIRNQYNNIVSKYQSHYKEYYKNSFQEYVKVINTINDTDKGTDIIAQYYAEAIEFNNFLQSAMLPSAVTSDVTSSGEKERLESAINNGKFNAVGLPSNSVSQLILENAVKNYAKLYVRSGYMKMEIKTTTFDVNNLTWNGYIIITNYSDESDTSTTKEFRATFTKDYATYLTQKAQKDIADAYKKDNTYFDVFSIEENSKFATALTLYNSDALINIYNAYESAMTVLSTSDNSGLNEIKNKYQNRLELISKEVAIRENECNIVSHTYSLLSNRLNQIHDILSIQNYLGKDLYEEFTLYIREDEYSNTNFVSDSLTNPMVSSQAKLFLETANKELIKASTPQHTINTSIKNLALIPEFKPYITDFALNNWIRVECDGIVYRLRLIGFSIDFGALSDISVEFSDVTIAPGFISDMQSLLQQASSMAGTYDYTVKQAEKGYQSNTTITDWIKEGLNSAEVVLKNNDNEEITTTRSGILGRAYDDITEDYDRHQFRLTHNMFAFTNNHWKPGSVISALGEHNYTYWNGTKFATATDYGLTTQFVQSGHIVGGQIIGSELLSSNWNGNNVGTYIDLNKNVVKLGDKLVFENNKLTFGSDVTLSWSNIPTDVASKKYATDVANAVDKKIDNFQQNVNKLLNADLPTTAIGSDYVFSPYIGGGYLYIKDSRASNNTGISVEINPNGTSFTGHDSNYVFNIQKDNNVIMGVTNNGSGYFSGNITGSTIIGSIIRSKDKNLYDTSKGIYINDNVIEYTWKMFDDAIADYRTYSFRCNESVGFNIVDVDNNLYLMRIDQNLKDTGSRMIEISNLYSLYSKINMLGVNCLGYKDYSFSVLGDSYFDGNVLITGTLSHRNGWGVVSQYSGHVLSMGWWNNNTLGCTVDETNLAIATSTYSDLRLKKDITSLSNVKDIYLDFKPKTYHFKDDGMYHSGRYENGLIAQEVINVFIKHGLNPDEYDLIDKLNPIEHTKQGLYVNDGIIYKLNYNNLHAFHIAAIQEIYKELLEKIKDLQEQIDDLKEKTDNG